MLRLHQEENKRAGLQRFLQTLNVNSGPGLKTFEVLCCVVHCFCLVSVAEDRSSIDSGRWRIRWEPYVTSCPAQLWNGVCLFLFTPVQGQPHCSSQTQVFVLIVDPMWFRFSIPASYGCGCGPPNLASADSYEHCMHVGVFQLRPSCNAAR